jgi:hypothetical protein
MQQEQIKLSVVRDFGETFNASIKFIRQNFKSYFLCILLLAGPIALLHSFFASYYQSVLLDKTSLVRAGRLYNMNVYGWEYFVSLFLQFLSSLALMCTTYAYMVVYKEKGMGNVTVSDVAKKMRAHTEKIIGAFFLFFFLILIFSVAVVVVVALFIQISPLIGGIMMFLLMIGFLLILPNISWQLTTSFLVIINDNEIPFVSFGRTREVMKNNYWWTWLLLVCSTLMVGILALLFQLPTTIYYVIKALSHSTVVEETSNIFLITSTLCTFCASMVYAIVFIICGFHFFSLEEQKEGAGLMERINEIGNNTIEKTEETV